MKRRRLPLERMSLLISVSPVLKKRTRASTNEKRVTGFYGRPKTKLSVKMVTYGL